MESTFGRGRKRGGGQVEIDHNLERDASMGSDKESDPGVRAYVGWVYHVGTNSLSYQYCHARYLVIKGKYVTMFKRDPGNSPQAVPIRRGVVGPHLMVEEVGRQIYHGRALYVLKIYSRLDHSRQGELACTTAEEAEKWVSAFKHAKEEADYTSERNGNGHRVMNNDDEFNMNRRRGHRSYTKGISKLITIGRGPESLLRRPSMVTQEPDSDSYYHYQREDIVEKEDWRCFHTVNGLRIFEDVTASKAEKGTIMKAVGVVESSPDTIFDMIMSLDKSLRYQWDVLTADLELVEAIDGHTDIVYGSFDPKYFKRFYSKRDFLFSRSWRRDQDGSYSIRQISTTHKKQPTKSGFQRIDLSPSIWEITPLPSKPGVGTPCSLVSQIVEVNSTGWGRWKKSHYSKFHKTIPYILLCRIAGIREVFAANPQLVSLGSHTKTQSFKDVKKVLEQTELIPRETTVLVESPPESQVLECHEEFYDAIMAEEQDEEDESDDQELLLKHHPKMVCSNHVLCIVFECHAASRIGKELDWNMPGVEMDFNLFNGSLRQTVHDKDSNGWSDPGGKGFMVRSRTYDQDSLKISGGEPLLKLVAVDWFKSEQKIGHLAKQPDCCVQSEAGRKAPFILVINLQVPAKPNYNLVFYFVAEKPIRPGSLLDRFANGDDAFRNSRFKLIPSIVEGYWMVKRAVGTKACLLGRAVTCHYLREDNFLEIDVDIGSSSVARGVVGLVLGYLTNVVVDLAILIEAKGEQELPEYLLGTVRINRIEVDSAVRQ
ncbi:unnamed protein product [Sphagnum jensenii]|uniref:START domain-containing protein n=1 Tax=Sphagnum jensenii TaxID=128206 RepID=A0ABP1C2F4_9BRYO